jgi:hypothetical protein
MSGFRTELAPTAIRGEAIVVTAASEDDWINSRREILV